MAHDDATQSPFTRPGFIAAAVVIALVAVLGVILAVVNATKIGADPEPTSSASTLNNTETSPTPTKDTNDSEASICKLEGESDEVPVSAPEALWEYQGTTAYPTSEEYGPIKDDPAGFRYCYQHSPTGAVFAAANAVVQGTDPLTMESWLQYFLASGPYREDVLAQDPGSSNSAGVRISIAGFRVLNQSSDAATVNMAVEAIVDGKPTFLSMVYQVVWESGDWKLAISDPAIPIDVAPLPDLSGFIAWGE